MEKVRVKIKKLHEKAVIPTYAHGPHEDAGMDLYAVERVVLQPNVPKLVKTGLSIELPPGFEAQIRPRSGLALKYGVTVLNSPGTVDPSYRGEIGVILLWNGAFNNYVKECESNHGRRGGYRANVFLIESGDRIAQMVIARYAEVEFEEAELEQSLRGVGGFGSTGM